jgi:hypothetical protein
VIDIRELNEVEPGDCCNPDATDFLFGGMTRRKLRNADKIQFQVADIDFNFARPSDDCVLSKIRAIKDRPNCSRVMLTNIDVTFAVTTLSSDCRITGQGFLVLRYLPYDEGEGFNEETNPSSVAFEIYTPYGVSYEAKHPVVTKKLVPTINFIGFIEEPGKTLLIEKERCHPVECLRVYGRNNEPRQGVSAQALAKEVAKIDNDLAIGLTIYFKAIYLVQYKLCHKGLAVPPKCTPIGPIENNQCVDFVEGDLLEQSIQPLEVACRPKTIKGGFCPVEDPTPAEPCEDEECDCCKRCDDFDPLASVIPDEDDY